jgi:hypothetical protein
MSISKCKLVGCEAIEAGSRENFIGDKISINPIIPFIAEIR